MTNKVIGVHSGNQIIPYGAATKQTKEVALTIGTVTTSAGNVSSPAVSRAVAVFYADSNGVWRMRFNVRITFTAITCTTVTVPVTGVLFKSQSDSFYQSTSGFFDAAAPILCFAFPNTANLYATLASTNISAVGFSGDVELESEPTTYTIAANMEGAVNASVYIPAADASTTGLITAGAQTVAGVKTFTNGISLGNETLSTYDEGTWTPSVNSSANVTLTGAFSYTGAYYTMIGRMVFCCISTLSWATSNTINTAGLQTYVALNMTGLPSVTDSTTVGNFFCQVQASPYETLPTIASASSGVLYLSFGSTAGLGVVNGDSFNIQKIIFTYQII